MTSYESACFLITCLEQQGIRANVTDGGVSIIYKRHQRETMLSILNALKDRLVRVRLTIYMIDKRTAYTMCVVRHASKPISVSHKMSW